MAKIDVLLEDLIESQVDALMQEDAYYEMLATPLKPAASVKKLHRKQLVEFFKLTDLQEELEIAPDLILNHMPHLISKEAFNQVKDELDKAHDKFFHFIQSRSDVSSEKPILFQEIYGLSDETLLQIYRLGVDFVKKGDYEDAKSLFAFLTTMAPHVASYWLAEGACFQALDRHDEAIAVFNAVKFLNPSDEAPYLYSIESYEALKDQTRAKLERDALKKLGKQGHQGL